MNRWILGGALAGVAYACLASRPARVHVSSPISGDPEDLMNLVARVEHEPELIPFVSRVEVERRHGTGMSEAERADYRVEVRVAGVPGWARFRKVILPAQGEAHWVTLDGLLGFHQTGQIAHVRTEAGAALEVTAVTRFRLPFAGPLLAHLSSPVLAYAFAQWLKNLDAEVAQTGDHRVSPSIRAPKGFEPDRTG